MKKQDPKKEPIETTKPPEAAGSPPPPAAPPVPPPQPISQAVSPQAVSPQAASPQADAPIRNKYADRMNRKKKMPKPAKFLITALALALLGGGGYYYASTKMKKPETVSDETAFSALGFLETFVEGYGRTAARRSEELGSEIKGTVSEVLVAAGDEVSAGDVLLTIDATDTRKELDEALDAQESARKSVEDAQRSLRKAQENVQKLTVTAPFSGKLFPEEDNSSDELNIRVDDELPSGKTIGVLVDDSVLHVSLYYSDAYIDKIVEGMPATVSVAYTMTSEPAQVEKVEKIERISPDGTKTFRVTLSFQNPGTLVKGMEAIGTILIDGEPVVPADTGRLEYTREKPIVLENGGTVKSVEGLNYYRFTEGQTILTLENSDLTDAVESAASTVESQQKMYAQRQERVAELQTLLEESTVVSPIDGIVIDISASEGEKVDGSRSLCTVADLSSVVVNATIPELDIDKIAIGQPVTLTMDSGDMFTGSVSSISMKAEIDDSGRGGSSANFPIVIEVDEGSGQTLSPNRSIDFLITTASRENCVTVPSSAVVYTTDGAAVYVKPAEGQTFENAIPVPEGSDVPEGFLLVPIETGISDSDNTEVLSGIGEGVEVFLAAPQDAYEQWEQMMEAAG